MYFLIVNPKTYNENACMHNNLQTCQLSLLYPGRTETLTCHGCLHLSTSLRTSWNLLHELLSEKKTQFQDPVNFCSLEVAAVFLSFVLYTCTNSCSVQSTQILNSSLIHWLCRCIHGETFFFFLGCRSESLPLYSLACNLIQHSWLSVNLL